MIDDDLPGTQFRAVAEGGEGEPGALEFVFQVRGMDENGKVVADGQVHVFLEDGEFVARVFVQA